MVRSTRPLECGWKALDMSYWKSLSFANILNSFALNTRRLSLITVGEMRNFANMLLRCSITVRECRKTWWYDQQRSHTVFVEFKNVYINFSPSYFSDVMGQIDLAGC